MSEPDTNKVIVQLRHNGIEYEIEGTMEGEFVRFPKRIFEQFPSIRERLQDGATLNNVWGILVSESGELLKKGQELHAKLRIGRHGAYAVAATTALLGVVVAIKTSQQRHHE